MIKEKCKEDIPMWFDKEGYEQVLKTDTHTWEEKETVKAIVQTFKCKDCGKETTGWKEIKEL